MGFPPSTNYGFCASCGTPRSSAAAQFCPNCGTSLTALEVPAPPTDTPPPVYTPPPTPPTDTPPPPVYTPPPAPTAYMPPPPAYAPPPAPSAYMPSPPAYNQPPAAYGQGYNAGPPTYVPTSRKNPIGLILAGLVVLCLVGAGVFFFLNSNSSGGITFSPSNVSCANPVNFTITLHLPSSVKSSDTLKETFDGKVVNTFAVSDDNTIVKQSDGSWLSTSTTSVDDMTSACAAGGTTPDGEAILVAGAHTIQILDVNNKVLASGSYTVSGAGANGVTLPPTKAPTLPPTAVPAAIGSLTFSPQVVNCDTPVDLLTTLTLPASVKDTDNLTDKFDGTTVNSFTITQDGTFTQSADGSWVSASTSPAAKMATDCAQGGLNDTGLAVLTTGTHTMTVLDATGAVLASGSYTVTAPAPTPAPTVVSYTGQILFSTDAPSVYPGCAPTHQVTSVSAKTSVYVIYIFGATADTNVLAFSVTKDGKTFIHSTVIKDVSGYDCMGDTTNLRTLTGWKAGVYEFTMTSDGVVIAVADLTVK